MRKLLFFLILFPAITFSQKLEEQVDSLSWMASGEDYGDKIPTARRILTQDPNNFKAHDYIVRSYINLEKYPLAYDYVDSVINDPSITGNVCIALAYGLRHQAPKDSLYDYHYFKVLKTALGFEESINEAAYFLSHTYYRDFILPTAKTPPTHHEFKMDSTAKYDANKFLAEWQGISVDSLMKLEASVPEPTSTYKYSADSALKYLTILESSNSDFNQIAKIPIEQLKAYLGKPSNNKLDSNLYNGHYAPEWYFGYLPEFWNTDFTIDLFSEMFWDGFGNVDFLSDHLQALEEPIIYKNTKDSTYRMTWLPSFDHPIVIRISENGLNPMIYWKVGTGAGEYSPEGILAQGKANIQPEEFKRISKLLDSTELGFKYTYDYIPLNDGAYLIVERSFKRSYKAHHTNWAFDEVTTLISDLAKKYFPEIETKIEDY